MNTTTTVALARAEWAFLLPNSPSQPTVDRFLVALNRAVRRLTDAGKWKGSKTRVTLTPYISTLGQLSTGLQGYISLPRGFQSILGARFNRVPVPTFGDWHQFVDSGPGELDPNCPTIGILTDLSDGHPTQRFIPAGVVATLFIITTNPLDAGKTVRINALDGQGVEIFDAFGNGFNIVTGFPQSPPSGVGVSFVSGLQAPIAGPSQTPFVGSFQLWYSANGQNVQIGQYQPSDRYPSFHWYSTGQATWIEPPGCVFRVEVLAQRRYVKLTAETDWVIPGNLEAIGCALRAINHENANRKDAAGEEWEDAFKRLNEEARSDRGGARVDAELAQGGMWGGWGQYGGYGGGGSGGIPNVI